MVVSKRKCVFQVVDDKKPKVVETIEPPPNKQQQILPRASDLTVQNRPQQTSTRLPSSAPVVVCLYKVTDRARDVWSVVEDTSAGLYQVQIKHDARPSVTFDILGSFGSYLQKANAENDDIPATLSDLSRNAFIKLVLTGDDPESVWVYPLPDCILCCRIRRIVKKYALTVGWILHLQARANGAGACIRSARASTHRHHDHRR